MSSESHPSTTSLPDWLSDESDGWKNVDVHRQLLQACRPLVEEFVGRSWMKIDSNERYLQRIWSAIRLHTPRMISAKESSLEQLLQRLANGDLGYARPQSNLIADLCLAQALELQEDVATRHFDGAWMPRLKRIALRVAGPRGEESIDNFLVELILPRDTLPPRIASYRGKTSLISWLSVVVTNHCHGRGRQRQDEPLTERVAPTVSSRSEVLPGEVNHCSELLQPVFRRAVSSIPAEDRLLLQFLLIDNVPQQEVARAMQIHSGNVTRRRQRAAASIWEEINRQADGGHETGEVKGCLELVLAGDNRELQQTLGSVLARSLPDSADEEELK